MRFERWRFIPSHTGYKVSDQGRIEQLRSGYGTFAGIRLLTPSPSGYVRIGIDGKSHRLHRLVLLAFVGPCPEGMECDHLNGDRADNRLENLRWVTPKENQARRLCHGTDNRGVNNAQTKLTPGKVSLIRVMWKSGEYTQREIGEVFNVRQGTISKVVRWERWWYVDWTI